ncbi:amidohydrolase family protein [Herbiconiux moechotypicola]|uniref:8-oxoguanine deaminase n=1 Tax=Herbiconiux moechotypicola TaxID=637393 RepID=A0ABN3DMK6_9MICO|nr:amidohydrolase family protein [Herbiconiux moechotypicola]MCS5730092.1 amidohydrolase family protein [Herbiconiux moechotypicola]
MRVVVAGGLVLTADHGSTAELDLLVDDGVIVATGPWGSFAAADGSVQAEVIDASGCLVTPGFVNGHTHSHSGILKGIAREWTLEHSLTHGAWMASARSDELTRLSALLTATELLSSGCTALFDLHSRTPTPTLEAIHLTATAYATTGIRATLAPMVSDRPLPASLPFLHQGCGDPGIPSSPSQPVDSDQAGELGVGGPGVAGVLGQDPQPPTPQRPPEQPNTAHILETCTALIESWPYDPTFLTPALAPTIPAHCTPTLTQGLATLARSHDLRLHTHLAESKPQALAGEHYFGRSITAELDRLGVLGPWLTAAHSIWTSPADNELLGSAGVTAVTVPASNLRLGSGVQDSRGLLDAGVGLAIGTDGANSSDALDMVDGIRLTALLSRVSERPAGEWLTVQEVLRAATAGGAAALGRADDLGVIAPGFAADLVLHDLSAVTYVPRTDVLNQLVTAGRAVDVRTVLVAGRVVYDRGAWPGLDVPALRARATELAAEYLERAAPARAESTTLLEASADSLAAARRAPWHTRRLLP